MRHDSQAMSLPAGRGAVDLSVRYAIGIAAVIFGFILLEQKSGQPHVLGRYTLGYAVLMLAYTPLLLAALLFAFRGGRVVALIRPVFSLRLFQLGLVFFLLFLAIPFIRFARHGEGTDAIRAVAISFFCGAYWLSAMRIAGRRGLEALRSSLVNASLLVGTIVLFSGVVSILIAVQDTRQADIVTTDEYQLVYELSRQSHAAFVYPGQPGRVREFRIPIQNNALGFNDRERTIENPDERFRIVVVGDSYVEAFHVHQGRSFARKLEDLLNQGDDRFEVIPLGRGGIGQEEEGRILQEVGFRFEPHLVILLFVSNDLYDNDPELNEDYKRFVRKWSAAPRVPRALFFPGLLADRLLTARLHGLVARYGYVIDEELATATIRPDFLAFIEPTPPKILRALKKTEQALDDMLEQVRARNAHFVLAARPNLLTRKALLRSHPALKSFNVDVESLTRWLQGYSESRSVPFLDLKPHFRAHLEAGGEPLVWKHDGHWNEAGHRLTAEVLHQFLVESEVLEN